MKSAHENGASSKEHGGSYHHQDGYDQEDIEEILEKIPNTSSYRLDFQQRRRFAQPVLETAFRAALEIRHSCKAHFLLALRANGSGFNHNVRTGCPI
jgi:hypothetical protein